jgi:hypothetical protein
MLVPTIAITSAVTVLVGAPVRPLLHADLTAPIVFVGVGGLSAAAGLVDAQSAPEALKPLVEAALVGRSSPAPSASRSVRCGGWRVTRAVRSSGTGTTRAARRARTRRGARACREGRLTLPE